MGSERIIFHDVCKLFPAMTEEEQDALVEDVRANGLRDPIVLHEGKLVDGRHRLLACQLAGVEPRFEEWDGQGSLVAFVLSRNIHRRHLTASQRAAMAADIADALEAEEAEKQAKKTSGPVGPEVDEASQPAHRPAKSMTKDAANSAGSPVRSTKRARRVKAAAPEVHEAVKAGKISLHAAEEQIAEQNPPADSIDQKRSAALDGLIAFERKALAYEADGGGLDVAKLQRGTKLCRDAFELPAGPIEPPVLTFPCAGPVKEWGLSQAQVDEWRSDFPHMDVLAECRKALVWVKANAAKRKTAKGMLRFLAGWLTRAQESGRGNGVATDPVADERARRIAARNERLGIGAPQQ